MKCAAGSVIPLGHYLCRSIIWFLVWLFRSTLYSSCVGLQGSVQYFMKILRSGGGARLLTTSLSRFGALHLSLCLLGRKLFAVISLIYVSVTNNGSLDLCNGQSKDICPWPYFAGVISDYCQMSSGRWGQPGPHIWGGNRPRRTRGWWQ